jgi:hypothetical protein
MWTERFARERGHTHIRKSLFFIYRFVFDACCCAPYIGPPRPPNPGGTTREHRQSAPHRHSIETLTHARWRWHASAHGCYETKRNASQTVQQTMRGFQRVRMPKPGCKRRRDVRLIRNTYQNTNNSPAVHQQSQAGLHTRAHIYNPTSSRKILTTHHWRHAKRRHTTRRHTTRWHHELRRRHCAQIVNTRSTVNALANSLPMPGPGRASPAGALQTTRVRTHSAHSGFALSYLMTPLPAARPTPGPGTKTVFERDSFFGGGPSTLKLTTVSPRTSTSPSVRFSSRSPLSFDLTTRNSSESPRMRFMCLSYAMSLPTIERVSLSVARMR